MNHVTTRSLRLLAFAVLVVVGAASQRPRIVDSGTTGDTTAVEPARISMCWAEGTDPEVIAASSNRRGVNGEMTSLSPDFYLGNRWTQTATDGSGLGRGDPTTLTWGFLPDGIVIPGAVGEPTSPSALIATLDGEYGAGPGGADLTQRPWFPLFQQVFDRWSAVAGVHYVYEPSDDGAAFSSTPGVLGIRADVRIGGHPIDGAQNALGYNIFPNTGDMILDTDDHALMGDTTGTSLLLRNLVAHEHGHGLGIAHSCPADRTKLMEPLITDRFDGPQHDDIRASNRFYGDPLEFPGQNDDFASATDLGVMAPGDTVRQGMLSIDGSSDQDYLAITLPDRMRLSVTMTPLGFIYPQGAERGPNDCPTDDPFYNSLLQNNLGFNVRGPNQNLLASAAYKALGSPEEVSDLLLLDGPGTYFVQVFGDTDRVQLYDLDVSISAGQAPVAMCKDVKTCNTSVTAQRVNNGSFDPDGDPITLTLNPAGPYAPGVNNVQLIVSDGVLADTCDATVTVNRAPTAVAKDVTVDEVGGVCLNNVQPEDVDGGSTDPDGDPILLALEPPGPYPFGANDVLLIASDACGLADTAAATVTVNCMVPVVLSSFNVSRLGEAAVLRWVVSDAFDHAGFHVHRQVAGGDRVRITDRLLVGRVDYEFTDALAPVGPADYWLEEVSRTAESSWHGPVHLPAAVPPGITLASLHPNPFSATTAIAYSISETKGVSLVVYDTRGRKVKTLRDEVQGPGAYRVTWDGRSEGGSRVAAGLYFVRFTAGAETRVQKAVYFP